MKICMKSKRIPEVGVVDEKKENDTEKMEGETGEPFRLTKENFPQVQTTLIYFIQLLATHAYVYLGLLPIPGGEETMFELEQAREAIDLLAIMVDQAKPKLDENVQRDLDNTVAQLRMNYAMKAHKTDK